VRDKHNKQLVANCDNKKMNDFFKKQKANRMLWHQVLFIEEKDAVKIARKCAQKVEIDAKELADFVIENRYNRLVNNSKLYDMLIRKFIEYNNE
jgi:hypothetical protein